MEKLVEKGSKLQYLSSISLTVCVCLCVCGEETSNRAQRPLFRAAVYSVREPFVECQEAAFHGRLFWC